MQHCEEVASRFKLATPSRGLQKRGESMRISGKLFPAALAAAVLAHWFGGSLANRDARAASDSTDVRGVAIQRNGMIVVAARTQSGSESSISVRRFTARGRPDPRFGDAGVLTIPARPGTAFASLAVDTSGRIVVFSRSGADYELTRLVSSGRVDNSFGIGGRVSGSIGRVVSGFCLDTKGRAVVVGTALGSPDINMAVVRHDIDGSPDVAFGPRYISISGPTGAFGVACDSKDRVLIVGGYGIPEHIAVVRLLESGQFDNSFGNSGAVGLTGVSNVALVIAISRGGHPVVAGRGGSRQDWSVIRFDQFGRLDSRFHSRGIESVPSTFPGDCPGLAIDRRGRVLVSGYVAGDAAVVRLGRNGLIDAGWARGTVIRYPERSSVVDPTEIWHAVATDSRGRVVLAGTRHGSVEVGMIGRLRANGAPDLSFGVSGIIPL